MQIYQFLFHQKQCYVVFFPLQKPTRFIHRKFFRVYHKNVNYFSFKIFPSFFIIFFFRSSSYMLYIYMHFNQLFCLLDERDANLTFFLPRQIQSGEKQTVFWQFFESLLRGVVRGFFLIFQQLLYVYNMAGHFYIKIKIYIEYFLFLVSSNCGRGELRMRQYFWVGIQVQNILRMYILCVCVF
eukprot:TRINITY_DN8215_c0_g1_i4.p1 TRINITY_DN8215_c0_g1~~TRINITY_DN8215_c0_g1_i4.p1  ORF type:complete len:202 (+),score=-3.31 TRINITY_DN8215_c0_g1_i4:60-608(+)